MKNDLEPLAQRIRESQGRIAENAEAIRKGVTFLKESEDKTLVVQSKSVALDFSVCAVDGGLLADRLFGADLLVGRSVAVSFRYSEGKLESALHFPSRFPETIVDFRTGLDEHDATVWRSLFRLKGELGAALDALEKFKPSYLFLDGSIVLLGSDRPSEHSALYSDYAALLNMYKSLYSRCEELGCQLVGVIKDSRGKRLAECLRDKLIIDVPDTVLADALLREGERTCAIPYTAEVQKHPVLSSLGESADRVKLFYLKSSDSDSPLRVEFLQSKKGKSADEIASIVHSLCSISKTFAYPAVLIEADMCAALEPLEMDKIKRSLFMLTGGASRPLRRAERPFR